MTADLRIPGVTVLERGWLSSNNVVLHAKGAGLGSASARKQAMVVDTGHISHAAQTLALLEAALSGDELVGIANTHLHSDHCGGNAAVSAKFKVPIWIPPGEFDAALAWDDSGLSFADTGQLAERFLPAGRLMPGSHLPPPFDQWQIHAAPGHDPASIILFELGSRTVISADALWENGFGIVFPELNGRDAFGEVEDSLDLIERLRPTLVIPGHGSPFVDVADALARARERLRYFRREPIRHAVHAAKALLVFHLMEVGGLDRTALIHWALQTPVYQRMWALVAGGSAAGGALSASEWVGQLADALLRAGHLSLKGNASGVNVLTAS
ncbi:MBL fold metallo-hydrolase [Roseateles terrae]|uniref:Glyoxylase-like metal-dependent hydrolase (Beta-lactamase superfamily II) n=1 Tax=Roseateles terrae TaxID=431060 RepID=A0ABR6GZL3_9BURK|nr:MBL fold metallo-hydrolase [Roseateles terrae]MBB3197191.1 glyoxylase-like metal-dependent hydrolase (beta-lactamase superfamily II) [Roseateles terrae]OWQ83740.1 hypothetical protein CDN98_22130 [Roseateles terrae]